MISEFKSENINDLLLFIWKQMQIKIKFTLVINNGI